MRASLRFILLSVAISCDSSSETPANAVVAPDSYLSSTKYTSLVIEIVSVGGYEPSVTAVDNLKNFLQVRLNKPSGITVIQRTIASPVKSVFTLEDILSLENSNRKQKTSGSSLTAFLLLVDGDYVGNSGSSKVLGIAYGTSSMTLFEKTILEFSGGIGKPAVSTLEATVMEHEFGHILGLVNNGTALQSAHQDSGNGKHCNNQDCLMYYNVETSDVVSNLLGGTIPDLDASCLDDLHANGGK